MIKIEKHYDNLSDDIPTELSEAIEKHAEEYMKKFEGGPLKLEMQDLNISVDINISAWFYGEVTGE